MSEAKHVPTIGDEVLYFADEHWHPAEIISMQENDVLGLTCIIGDEMITQYATHGRHQFGWLTYAEAAQSVG